MTQRHLSPVREDAARQNPPEIQGHRREGGFGHRWRRDLLQVADIAPRAMLGCGFEDAEVVGLCGDLAVRCFPAMKRGRRSVRKLGREMIGHAL
jgi:hypothetical protein